MGIDMTTKWIEIPLNRCFITRETENAIRIRLPRWIEDVKGSFWLPKKFFKEGSIVIPDSLMIKITYKKSDDFGVFGEWQSKEYPAKVVKNRMFLADGHDPALGDIAFTYEAEILEPVHTEPLEELIDA